MLHGNLELPTLWRPFTGSIQVHVKLSFTGTWKCIANYFYGSEAHPLWVFLPLLWGTSWQLSLFTDRQLLSHQSHTTARSTFRIWGGKTTQEPGWDRQLAPGVCLLLRLVAPTQREKDSEKHERGTLCATGKPTLFKLVGSKSEPNLSLLIPTFSIIGWPWVCSWSILICSETPTVLLHIMYED